MVYNLILSYFWNLQHEYLLWTRIRLVLILVLHIFPTTFLSGWHEYNSAMTWRCMTFVFGTFKYTSSMPKVQTMIYHPKTSAKPMEIIIIGYIGLDHKYAEVYAISCMPLIVERARCRASFFWPYGWCENKLPLPQLILEGQPIILF